MSDPISSTRLKSYRPTHVVFSATSVMNHFYITKCKILSTDLLKLRPGKSIHHLDFPEKKICLQEDRRKFFANHTQKLHILEPNLNIIQAKEKTNNEVKD